MKSNEGVVILWKKIQLAAVEKGHRHLHTVDGEDDDDNEIVRLKMVDVGHKPSSGCRSRMDSSPIRENRSLPAVMLTGGLNFVVLKNSNQGRRL